VPGVAGSRAQWPWSVREEDRKPKPLPGGSSTLRDMADLLVVDGNPMENIDLLARPEENLVLIMKDGKIYKDTIRA
jgi:hypothetical protein